MRSSRYGRSQGDQKINGSESCCVDDLRGGGREILLSPVAGKGDNRLMLAGQTLELLRYPPRSRRPPVRRSRCMPRCKRRVPAPASVVRDVDVAPGSLFSACKGRSHEALDSSTQPNNRRKRQTTRLRRFVFVDFMFTRGTARWPRRSAPACPNRPERRARH